MNYLVSFNEVTDSIQDIITDDLGPMAWATIPLDMVFKAIEHVNISNIHNGCDSIVTDFTTRGLWVQEHIRKIDRVVELFESTLLVKDHKGKKLNIDYDRESNSAIIEWTDPVLVVNTIALIKEEYSEAVSRNDYMPDILHETYRAIMRHNP